MIVATVAGNLGADAETARTNGGGDVVRFRVASSVKRGQNELTTWVGCSWFGKRAVAVLPYLTKGKAVVVAGELSTTEKDGKTYVNLDVSSLKLMGGERGERRTEPSGSVKSAHPAELQPDPDDEIPF